jgi:hypothetical protein
LASPERKADEKFFNTQVSNVGKTLENYWVKSFFFKKISKDLDQYHNRFDMEKRVTR